MQYLDAISKMTEWLLFVSEAYLSISWYWSLCPDHNAEKAEVKWFYEDLQELLELTRPTQKKKKKKKRCPFHYRGLESKSRKSRNTWSNRQIWHWSTEWSRSKANRVCQENTLIIANTFFQQHKRRLYTWTSPDGQHWNQIDSIVCSQRWRTSIQLAKTRLRAACDSDHELLIDKFRLKLKKVGKTTRPFRYDLNQIPYDYTVEVRKRFKELDQIDRVPDKVWMEVHDIVQETGSKTTPKKRNGK